MDFSERLKALRTRLGLTQRDFAEKLKLSVGYVYQLEAGKRAPSESLLVLLDLIEKEAAATPSPRSKMRDAREAKGWTIRDLSKATGYAVGVLQAMEEASGRASEKMINAISTALGIPVEDLMQGSDAPKIIDETGRTGTMGAIPNLQVPPGTTARIIPHLSFAQAGKMEACWEDGGYEYEGRVALNVKDPKAFTVEIRGDSMEDKISPGDTIMVYPSKEPRNGSVVLARLTDDAGGDVFCKLYTAKNQGKEVLLTSFNPAYPPMEYRREDFRFIYPVVEVRKPLTY
ncbi:helix-turn-helix domain-containing protein [Verrucomicrobium spinosum]|uniref:helix-turn-helix domain-containing protein n=2 Tax=Verrucomicrobium spinosum TaxID=2736 RepID=UPI0001746690|nr:helix-turn-helix domain-containing protein [Verrucomicrobium spinosum]